ncbi:hypothetical protein GW17_00060165 [Ensete ventricosum]|nr:hypothetical protein GW17_00060165 [Ensete ventricosum]
MKKCDGHKLCAKSRTKSSFDRFFVHYSKIQNTGHSQRISPCLEMQNTDHSQCISPWEVVRVRFHEKM